MIKPRVVAQTRKEDKISNVVIKDIVKKLGRSGYVALPRELIGKYVKLFLVVLE